MTTEFDDELLSAVLDGEADPETVAAVQADADASARLRSMQAAASLVGTPPAPATPERRAASIAAALAAAQPAPEVSSLSVARERKAAAAPKRRQVNWLAVAAAFAFVLLSAVAITNVVGGGSADTVDTATDAASDATDDAADAVDDGAFAADSAMAEAVEETMDTADESAADVMMDADDAMEEDAMEEADDAMEEDAMEDDGADDTAVATTTTTARTTEPFATNNVLLLEEAIDLGTVAPVLRPTDPELLDVVNSTCIDPDLPADVDQFALAELGEFAPPPALVVVQFDATDPTQVIGIFNAEDCSPVG